jgi:hypothetical protein
VGQQVALSAAVSAVAPGAGTPGGTVTFFDNGTQIGLPVAMSGGSATLNTSALTAGSHTIRATYSGDGNFNSGDSNVVGNNATQQVNKVPTSLSLDPVSSTFGGTITLLATLTANGSGVSGETIGFSVNGNGVGTAVTNGSGVATLSNVSLVGINANVYPIGASFAGDATYLSSSDTSSLTVNKLGTTLSVASASGMVGGLTTLQATLKDANNNALSGRTVTFTLNGNSFSGNTAVTNGSGVATLSNVSLAGIAAGSYPNGVGASFAAETNYAAGSGTGSLTVNQPGSNSDSVGEPTSNHDPAAPNTSLTFGATVSFSQNVGGGPSGTVAFYDGPLGNAAGSTLLGSGTLSVSGNTATASLTVGAGLSAGSHTIWADYFGDANYAAGVSSVALIQAVNSANAWITFPALQTPRYFAAAALLANGKVLVAGGRDSSFTVLNTAELYDPTTGHWTSTNPLKVGRTNATASLITSGTHNGQVMLAGGTDGNGHILNSVEFYDPTSNSWTAGTATENMPTARVFQNAVTLGNGHILVLGGSNKTSGRLNSADVYDPGTDTWSSFSTTSWQLTGQAYGAASLLSAGSNAGRVLLAGGENTSFAFQSSTNALDPAAPNSTPTALASLNTGRAFAAGVTLTSGANNGRVLVIGGEGSGNALLNTTELYNPVGNSWTPGPALPSALVAGQAVVLSDGQVLYLGGQGAKNAVTGGVLMYTPASPA